MTFDKTRIFGDRVGTSLLGLALVLGLSACGGGSSSTTTNTNPPNQTPVVVDTGPLSFTPSAQTLASKTTSSGLTFNPAIFTNPGGCTKPITNKLAYVQTHTAVFAADGVAESDLIEAAEHAENAVKELRLRLANAKSATLGLWNNKRVFVCVQNESTDGGGGRQVGRAAPGLGPDFAGQFMVMAASRYFSILGAPRDTIATGGTPGKSFQATYQRVFVHEMVHMAEFAQASSLWFSSVYSTVDPWFTEGVAKHFEFGKLAISKEVILGDFASANPIKSNNGSTALPSGQYLAASAIFAYLLSPQGANNSEATVTAFFSRLALDTEALDLRCNKTPNPTADCPSSVETLEAWRKGMFERNFEASFKEKDGSPMKLRTGANNLQDTIVSRLNQFW
jgi:hypothetical protein